MHPAPGDQPIELLFVDDERDNYDILEQRLIDLFDQLHAPVRLTFKENPDEACRMIATRSEPYQVVIADLLWKQTGSTRRSQPDARGLDVVKRARNVSDRTVVVVITQGSREMPQLETLATQRGADIVRKPEDLLVVHGGPEGLVREIYDLLCERGLVDAGPEIRPEEDEPGILTVQDDVGNATLRHVGAGRGQGAGCDQPGPRCRAGQGVEAGWCSRCGP